MAWSNDPEMQKMFLDEVTERSARLVEGAQALRGGAVSPQEAGDLLREGHTIKGTGRVMGYEDVGSAGLMLEMIWRWIQQGEITPSPIFGRILEALSAAIPSSLDDPAELAEAMAAVHEFFEGQELPEELPPVPQVDPVALSGAEQDIAPDFGSDVVLVGEEAVDTTEVVADAPESVESADESSPEQTQSLTIEQQAFDASEPFVEELGKVGAVEVPVDEPASSAHDAFARLAGAGVEPGDDGVVEEPVDEPASSAHDAFARLAGAGVDSGEEAAVEELVGESVVSAHDAFARLAGAGVDSGEEAAVEALADKPVVLTFVENESPREAHAEAETSDEEAADAARSAQQAFAELRRSMMQEGAAAEIAAEPADHGDDADTDDPGEVEEGFEATGVSDEAGPLVGVGAEVGAEEETEIAMDDLPFTIAANARATVDEPFSDSDDDPRVVVDEDSADAGGDEREEALGALIEFPVSDDESGVPEVFDDEPASDLAGTAVAASDPGVVALPSNRKPVPRDASGVDDLGGLVKAVQTWAAEEAIAVNTGRLYELVNHIVTLRMDLEAVKEQLAEFAEVAVADPFFSDRVSAIAQGIEPVSSASELIETKALALAAAPLQDVTNTLPQLGRYLSRKTGKELTVEIVGDDILVDRQVLERLGDAVRQLVVNSAVHGIEDIDTRLGAGKSGTGLIRIEAKQSDVNLEVSVVDDGRGIDWRAIREKGLSLGLLDPSAELAPDALRSLLYQNGFTTRDVADDLAGDGDGLAVVREAMESLNGSLRVESTPKVETRISMVVPVHQAMQNALLVKTGGIMWGIPETGVLDVVDMNLATIAVADHTTVLERIDGDVPFASFADLMGIRSDAVPASIVVATSAAGPVALGVEEVIGIRRVAAKELGAVLADAQAAEVTGAALLGGEQVVLLVDPTRLAERQREVAIEAPAFPAARVLIVDDSVGVQQVVSSALATSGFNTSVAASVADALGALHSGSIDAVVVDFSMPRADGVALAHMVRQRHGDLPIVMLSGVAEGEDVDRAREAGVDAFFDKADFREGGLAEKLRELITLRREKEQTA